MLAVIDGRAVSVFDDPFRVGGLPVADGDSGRTPVGCAATDWNGAQYRQR